MLCLVADDDRAFVCCSCGKRFLWSHITKEIELQRLVFCRVGDIAAEIGTVVSQESDILAAATYIKLVACFKVDGSHCRIHNHL